MNMYHLASFFTRSRRFLLLGLILVLAVSAAASDLPAGLEIGGEAPSFFLRDLDNQNFFLSRAIKEKQPIVLSFFATWCVPCRAEIPALEAKLKDPRHADLTVIYVHVGEPKVKQADPAGEGSVQMIRQMQAELGMTRTILYDRYGVAAEKYGATSLPCTVVIAPDGTLAYHHTGYKDGDIETLFQVLAEL